MPDEQSDPHRHGVGVRKWLESLHDVSDVAESEMRQYVVVFLFGCED